MDKCNAGVLGIPRAQGESEEEEATCEDLWREPVDGTDSKPEPEHDVRKGLFGESEQKYWKKMTR